MNDAQHAVWNAYARLLANHLLLTDWEIIVDREQPRNATSCAEVWPSVIQNRAVISLSHPGLFGEPPERIREVITHELLHLHCNQPHNTIEQLAEQFNENTACQFAKEAHRKQTEILTQTLARVIAPHLPLPPTM